MPARRCRLAPPIEVDILLDRHGFQSLLTEADLEQVVALWLVVFPRKIVSKFVD